MRARYHRFLLALLMLVLPLQGFAFVSMLGRALASQPAAAQQMAHSDADDMMASCHDHGQPDSPAPQHDCQHCAACVLGSALPVPAAADLAALPASRSFTPHPATPYSGFIPDGPERPPRPFLA